MFDVLFANAPYLLRATGPTLVLASSGLGMGIVLGLATGVLSVIAPAPIRWMIATYVFAIRGIPVLVWLFLSYYALPAMKIFVNDFVAVTGALVVYTAAFVTEIVRGAILSIPRGQIDAAKAIGMRRATYMRLVILPQAIKVSIPPLLNTSIMMIKASSYVSVVGVWELTYAAREVVERTLAPFQIFFGVMLIYFLICYPLALGAQHLERRFAYQH